MAQRLELLSLSTAAQELGVSVKTVKKWQQLGRLPVYKVGPRTLDCRGRDRRACRISRAQIADLLEAPAELSRA
jgi:excisionase family DNA binding protein